MFESYPKVEEKFSETKVMKAKLRREVYRLRAARTCEGVAPSAKFTVEAQPSGETEWRRIDTVGWWNEKLFP